MKRLVILGAGGYGHTVADVAHQLGYSTIVLDDANLAPSSIKLFILH